jgi:spore coat polysaccharide biosynthesis protein SpsF
VLGCIIQARMGSTRLPGKVMRLLDGTNPSIFFTVEQLKNCPNIDKIIIATTTNPEDDQIESFCKKIGIDVFRGESDDVLLRYYNCAQSFSLDSIIRVTADCPLIDPSIVEKGISIFKNNNYDYVTNTNQRTYPDGNETELFSFSALEKANYLAKLPSEREHVTPFFKNNQNIFKIFNFEYKKNLSELRWTMDYEEDAILISTIIKKIENRPFTMDEILNVLETEPDLIKINEGHHPNEAFAKSLKADEVFLEKNPTK